ncbi:MAG: hypothetical protein K0Q66_1963 [Chitinophagaceae bacterium]|jgi:hypothetical protein|nr:hypothetical protein [Chitinophagaceae bacterium]
MKKILSIIALSLIAIASNAQPPDVPAEKGAKFGAEVTADDALTVEKAIAKVQQNEGKKTEVKIIGEVVEVCQMKGCWITIKNGTEEITVKMKGHNWFVPSALAGKTVVLQGVAELKTTSVDDLKHKAEDAGKSKEEVDAIKESKKEIVVNAVGILVV